MESGLMLEETELRLGLPGGGAAGELAEVAVRSSGKRGFLETIDLKLKLQTPAERKELESSTEKGNEATDPHENPPASKAQVVGWPPVRSFRKNILNVQQQSESKNKEEQSEKTAAAAAAFVKVSMDGAPYLRKVDLKTYKSYQELSTALQKMFSSFATAGNYGSELQGVSVRDFMNGAGKVMALVIDGSEYVPTYEDKDGDWMLVGDVPWQMFVDSCKRLRVMKGSEVVGLAPRVMEKRKINRG